MKQIKPTRLRRIASNEVITPEGQSLIQYVVELWDGYVERYFPLQQEMSNTEWMQGQIILKKDTKGIRAYYKGISIT